MPRYFVTRFCCFLLGMGSAMAASFEKANEQFRAEDFTGAASTYEKVLTETGPNASTYYNLGNAYQSLKQYGPAILAYERARLLKPRDPDLRANLALARKDSGLHEESGRPAWVENVLTYLSRRECSWLLVGAACTLGLLMFLDGLVRLPKPWLLFVSLLSSLFILGAASLLWVRRGESQLGVIVAPEAHIRLSPFEKAESVASPSPGRMVRLGARNGDFYYVEVPGANLNGWVASRDVAPLIPTEAP
jgi:hypothetical protein